MPSYSLLISVFLFAFLLNVPLGYWRQGYKKLTFGWFYYTHLSIPIILLVWANMGGGAEWILPSVTGALIGQFLGSRIAQRWRKPSWDMTL